MDTATKTGIDAAKTASKRVIQKTAEARGDLIGNKIADKITSVAKINEKTNKPEEIYIPPEKRQQIIDDHLNNHNNHNNHNNINDNDNDNDNENDNNHNNKK